MNRLFCCRLSICRLPLVPRLPCQSPEALQLSALLALQLRITLSPCITFVLLLSNCSEGAAGCSTTRTVA